MTEKCIVTFFLPNLTVGGAERALANLATGFVRRGFETDFLLVKAQGELLANLPEQVRVVDLNLPSTYACLYALIRYLRQRRPSIVISALDLTNLFMLLARRFSSVPLKLAITLHSTISIQHRPFTKKKLEKILLGWLYPAADEIVAVSRGVAEDYCRYTGLAPKRVRVIYNPIILPGLSEQCCAPLEHPWFQPGQPPVILGVGRLAYPKNFHLLIRAFRQVREKHKCRLLILGEGEQRPELEALAADSGLQTEISMPGVVKNPYAYMSRAAGLVLSSHYEGLPTVLVEAMACGCPVISTDCPSGPKEILNEGQYGYLVPMDDAASLAQAISRTLAGETRRPPDAWLKQFELDYATEQYIRLFEQE
ncbi:MAG TPA: glycosyltransferase [Anaerolineales bacterium]|nr:glycosyltransferase [Anaerolineales bacterium]